MRTVGRQAPQLCARKVGHNEARRLSPAFGKDELNLGIAQSPSTRRIEPHPAPLRPQWRERPASARTIVSAPPPPRKWYAHMRHTTEGLAFFFSPPATRNSMVCPKAT